MNNKALMLFDPVREIIISVDASLYGLGAVLSQKVDGVERPVWFCSRTFLQTEQNYAQVHKEALALIFALQKFH
ncbi:MAG: ribonuclease H family protein [Janthinobacterium lividum]